jgi:hypothetical protein
VAAAGARDSQALPDELAVDRAGVEAAGTQAPGVLGLAEHRHVPREKPRARLVEVILVEVGNDGGVETLHDLLGRDGQRHERVRSRARRVLDGRPRTHWVEHRLDQDAPLLQLDQKRRVADQCDAHAGTLEHVSE